MKKFLFLVVIFGGALLFFHFKDKDKSEIIGEVRSWMGGKKKYRPGILIEDLPQFGQVGSAKSWTKGNYTITPVAKYRVRCRVLQKWVDLKSTEYQRQLGELGRVEAALGWGPASDQDVMDHIVFYWQQGWYSWRLTDNFEKYPWPKIHANMCYARLIAEPEIEERLVNSVGPGDLIEIDGYLINAVHSNGQWGFSSPTDNDYSEDKIFRYIWVDSLRVI
jgi:hypothetical protein